MLEQSHNISLPSFFLLSLDLIEEKNEVNSSDNFFMTSDIEYEGFLLSFEEILP